MTPSKMLEEWYKYARQNRIQTPSFPGRKPEHTDLVAFLKSKDINDSSIKKAFRSSKLKEPEPELGPRKISQLAKLKDFVDNLTDQQKKQFLRDLK